MQYEINAKLKKHGQSNSNEYISFNLSISNQESSTYAILVARDEIDDTTLDFGESIKFSLTDVKEMIDNPKQFVSFMDTKGFDVPQLILKSC